MKISTEKRREYERMARIRAAIRAINEKKEQEERQKQTILGGSDNERERITAEGGGGRA